MECHLLKLIRDLSWNTAPSAGVDVMLIVILVGVSVAVVAGAVLTLAALGDVAFSGHGVSESARVPLTRSGLADSKCPSCGNHKIRVTPPETFAILNWVRKTLPSSEVQRIYDRSTENAGRAKGLSNERYAREKIVCPLLTREGGCAAYSARPLHCRTWCLTSGAEGDRCLLGNAGVEDSITQGLTVAGLEGDVYELNSALAVALQNSDAASRWATGQAVFAGCEK